METARRNAAGAGQHDLAAWGITQQAPDPSPVPEVARGWPWPAKPPRELCDAQPARWAELKAQRDPCPEWFEGTEGMASYHRATGWRVEHALRESPADCWWYDPELPLALIMGGFPRWDRFGVRTDSGEAAGEFASIVADYEREMSVNGTIFPPLVVHAIDPADRAAVGWVRWLGNVDAGFSDLPHYIAANGRHRSIAAWRCGLTTFPAFCLGPPAAMRAAALAYGNWLAPVDEVARQRARTGNLLAELEKLGPVRVVGDGPAAAAEG